MTYSVRLIGLLIAGIVAGPIYVNAQEVNIKATAIDRPRDTSVGYGEVYGYVKFSSSLRDTSKIATFLDILVSEQFGSDTDGNFLVTLAVSEPGAAKPLAERPILTGARKSKKFLWITTQTTESGTTDLGGIVLDGLVVQSQNNNLRVSLRSYVTDKVSFDTKAYSELIKLADAARAVAGIIAVPALITGNADGITKILETAMSRNTSKEKILSTEMSFINKDGFTSSGVNRQAPKKQRLLVTAKSEDTDDINFTIDVEFETRPSAIGIYDTDKVGDGPNRKGFSGWAESTRFIEAALIPLGNEKIKVAELIEKSGPKQIATAWTMLLNGPYDEKKNGSLSIATVCTELYGLVRKIFSERDAVGLYWDILHQLRDNLVQTPGAAACVKAREGLFQIHGLKLDKLADIKS